MCRKLQFGNFLRQPTRIDAFLPLEHGEPCPAFVVVVVNDVAMVFGFWIIYALAGVFPTSPPNLYKARGGLPLPTPPNQSQTFHFVKFHLNHHPSSLQISILSKSKKILSSSPFLMILTKNLVCYSPTLFFIILPLDKTNWDKLPQRTVLSTCSNQNRKTFQTAVVTPKMCQNW